MCRNGRVKFSQITAAKRHLMTVAVLILAKRLGRVRLVKLFTYPQTYIFRYCLTHFFDLFVYFICAPFNVHEASKH